MALTETPLEAQTGRLENSAEIKHTVWTTARLTLAITVASLFAVGSGAWALIQYKTDQNTTALTGQTAILLDHGTRLTKVETTVIDMKTQLNRIEDNSRVAIGAPPIHQR